MTVQEIKKVCEDALFGYYGIRADDLEYQIGATCNNSHQLFQDPDFDEEENLIYPAINNPESPYYGFYDAGELDGTCAVKFDPNNENSISVALNTVKTYSGKNLYIIAGDSMEYGNDEEEVLIRNAEVIGRWKKDEKSVW